MFLSSLAVVSRSAPLDVRNAAISSKYLPAKPSSTLAATLRTSLFGNAKFDSCSLGRFQASRKQLFHFDRRVKFFTCAEADINILITENPETAKWERTKEKVKPLCLIIRDGWGHNENPVANATLSAETPNLDSYLRTYPWTLVDTCGEAVGLPPGYQGSSEAGHLNIGAGRVVEQELKRIDDAMATGALWELEAWKNISKKWKDTKGSKFHLFVLLQDEGVHGHQEHLFKIMRRLRKEHPEGEIVIHPFLDGRDTPPRSTKEYIAKLLKVMAEVGNCSIGTTMGRYFSMDRSKDWKLTSKAFNCIVSAEGKPAPDILTAVDEWYAEGPENSDEYVPPYVIGDYKGMQDGDCVIHVNYRQDRAIQLTLAFVDDQYPGKDLITKKPKVEFLGLTRYYDEFENFLLGPMGDDGGLSNLLGEVLSKNGYRQLRIAETQKFRHVTSFFNGKATTPFPGEEQIEVKGRFEPDSFAQHPEMEAYIVTDEILKRLQPGSYEFIAVNFANADMVGHTGVFQSAVKACEVVDECVGRVVDHVVNTLGGHVLITADHGNSDQMLDYETGMTKTSHSLHPVELIYVAKDAQSYRMTKRGKLGDIAPTILALYGLPVPSEMDGDVLVEKLPAGVTR